MTGTVYETERTGAKSGSRPRCFEEKPDPTPAEIAEATAAIRASWPDAERRRRSVGTRKWTPAPSIRCDYADASRERQAKYRRALASCFGKPITRHDAPATRRARAIERDIRPTRRRRLWLAAEGRCSYCGRYHSFKRSSLDHVQPRSRGGGNGGENVLIACRRCNGAKAAMGLVEWSRMLTSWAERVAAVAGQRVLPQPFAKVGSSIPIFLPADAHEVRLRLPRRLYDRLVALRGPAPVAGLLSELLHEWLSQHENAATLGHSGPKFQIGGAA